MFFTYETHLAGWPLRLTYTVDADECINLCNVDVWLHPNRYEPAPDQLAEAITDTVGSSARLCANLINNALEQRADWQAMRAEAMQEEREG